MSDNPDGAFKPPSPVLLALIAQLEAENARLRRDLDLTRAAFRAPLSQQEKP